MAGFIWKAFHFDAHILKCLTLMLFRFLTLLLVLTDLEKHFPRN